MGGLLVDYNHYKRLRNCSFLKLFIVYPEFRYQFFYRLRLHSPFLRILLKPLQLINPLNLYIHYSDIGEGIFIEHGFSTIKLPANI